ncbi:hypothetical protein JXB01_00780 [Candidatus Micrarchaeota archaeon]|nr:hypothetical protein [Candidatus Micrarchaeota archaeon]
MAYIENLLDSILGVLRSIGPTISLIMILLGGIIYALSQAQPAETRGKWVTTAVGLLVGGVIVGAIVGAASMITDVSMQLLT